MEEPKEMNSPAVESPDAPAPRANPDCAAVGAANGSNSPSNSSGAKVVNADTKPPVLNEGAQSSDQQSLTTKIIDFLASASPGTLGGVAVGLAATTYFVLGRLGLVLIGAFGGIVSFIHWEQRNVEVARAVRGEKGLDLLERLLAAKKSEQDALRGETGSEEQQQDGALIRSFDDLQPETREALTELVDAVIDNYVKWWYSPIVPADKFFPLACRKTLTSFVASVANCLRRKRPADMFLDFVTNSSSLVVVFLSELSNAFAELPPESGLTAADAVYNYLASHPDSSLATLLNQKQQAHKFRMAAEDLVGFLDRSTYECDAVRIFLREILAGVILETALQKCSKADWINTWIVYFLESGEPDFSQAIDQGMQTGPGSDIVFADFDGNVGNIGLTKGNRNSFEQERARRKESLAAHKKKLSKADEEMELAMEGVNKLNGMVAQKGNASTESLPLPNGQQIVGYEKKDGSEKGDQTKSSARPLRMSGTSIKTTASEGLGIKISEVSAPSTYQSEGLTPSSQDSFAVKNTGSQFTSFDQILPPARDEPEIEEDKKEPQKPPLTLHNAIITVLDEPGDGRIRSRPTWDYLVQIEPATIHYPGWMIVRKYSDFEAVHEVLRRIAAVSGATEFTEQHSALPSWKQYTRTALRGELERYLRDACKHRSLAESEGLKRFLERDHGHIPSAPKSGFEAVERLGKNVLGVLASAPLEGSKAVVGGVTSVLGNIGLVPKKQQPQPQPSQQSVLQDVTAASRLSISSLPRADSSLSLSGRGRARDSMDSQRSSIVNLQPGRIPPMERRASSQHSQGEGDATDAPRRARSSREYSRGSSRAPSRAPSRGPGTRSSPSPIFEGFQLPPPPDMIPDDYEIPVSPSRPPFNGDQLTLHHQRSLTMPTLTSHQRLHGPPLRGVKQHAKLTEQETRVAVELLFAVINELYTLSSAWNIRRTLLAAAKSFLLRPGNPSLLSIQNLIQESVLDANTSDSGIAAHLRKLRQNALPTEEEKAAWPAEMTEEEREKLRAKARKLLIESGVPAALMGVMGQAATSEALGRLFDCLQIEEIARGLMFGVIMQAVRTVTH